MNTKNLVLMALLVGVGAALYVVIPGFNGGMKPDFMLTMMFIGILLFPRVKEVFLLAVTTGIISGLFSTFPGGFVPNIIDKFVTAFIFYVIVVLLKKMAQKIVVSAILAGIGTIISGSVFLGSAIVVTGANIPFGALFLTVVLPAVAINIVAFVIIYPIIMNLVKRSKFTTALHQA
ncbi:MULTISPECIES: tryptophan transporter [unclassified Rummeliibacillus]|uniref:tryptophan transporter n=1 Tax=unclassified Rummeliibacillus TaxID=2622809 RepID=UPI000E670678|nr:MULTISPECIES: tryptophan transporter [unclassified Rummeliibacillus]RIJ67914.1 tryptophan transporter [Rummeliibacillus sp. POC4]RPJ95765.1 tryptophan transporter [Rummeliibacillus sp. TYF005]